jgi:tetratricopeptide (TPR) repeat protein
VLLWKKETKETRLAYPEKEKALEYSQKYVWSVTARLPGDEEKRVVEQSNFKRLLKGEPEALAPVGKLAASKEPADLLLAATAYEAYGVHDEALKLFEKLAELQPRVANYQLALARYYRHAGREDLAKEALERARKLGAEIKP